jgi:hydrogenase maturation protease
MKSRALRPMPRVLIIGCGNPLRGDDGVAWRLTEELMHACPDGTEVLCQHQLTPELACPVSTAETVLFLDADAASRAGEIRCCELAPQPSLISVSHELSPAALLALSQKLYGKAPHSFAISIGAENFSHSESLSPEMEAALPHVRELLNRWIGQETLVP